MVGHCFMAPVPLAAGAPAPPPVNGRIERRLVHVALGAAAELEERAHGSWLGKMRTEGLSRARDLVHTQIGSSPRLSRWEARGERLELLWRRRGERAADRVLDEILALLAGSASTWSFVDTIVRHLIDNRVVRALIDDIVAYLVNHPMVLTLVREQSVGFTDEVVGAARERLTEVDGVVDRIVAQIRAGLHRGGREGARAR
jgi:hypothetical protein